MSQLPLAAAVQPGVVNSLFVELADEVLLLPMSAVAEVVRDVSPQATTTESDWLYGWLAWRNTKIPLVSVEALAGGDKPNLPEPAHAVVLNVLGDDDTPFYALLVQSFPRPVRIAEDDNLQQQPGSNSADDKNTLMRVSIGKQQASIPNLEQIEQSLLQQLRNQH